MFKQAAPNFSVIAAKAFAHAKNYSNATTPLVGRKLLLNNFSNADGPFLFISTSFVPRNEVGYFISNHNKFITSLGCGPISGNSRILIELQALQLILHELLRDQVHLHHIFTTSREVYLALNGNHHDADIPVPIINQ